MCNEHQRRYRELWAEQQQRLSEWHVRWELGLPRVPFHSSPEFCSFTCSATTRKGTPCKHKSLYSNGRCKLHGGLSTGPKTAAGKEQARVNGRKGGRPRKPKPMDC
ncbi:HGGxSTG domain-containing protein [Azovibrio restrictus]|uniref:HGGxSTG domain-containing protein n=1 Tax=Azovibrio restrictus TaxID=146938 RepID=UPI003CCBFB1A